MRASNPACFSSAPQAPPTSAAPKPPLSGERAPIAFRDAPEMGRPVSTPGAKISLFSGPSGSAPAGTSRSSTSAMRFQPPTYRRSATSPGSSTLTLRELRSMRRIWL